MKALRLDLDLARGPATPESFRLTLALEAPAGVTVLFGPSGSGKSTTLAAVAGLVRPDRGRVLCDERVLLDTSAGIDLPRHERRLGLVAQEGLLFPHLTVAANLRYGASRALGRTDALDEREVVSVLELEPFLERRPSELSGGERQRVALGRALLSGPDALLLDEPLASLDRERRARIVPYLQKIKARFAAPVLYVTHALDEALALGDRVCVLAGGRAVAQGTPAEVFASPRDPLVARLAGFENVVELAVVAHDAEDGVTRASLGAHEVTVPRASAGPGARVRYGLLATDVLVATRRPEGLSARNALPAKVAALDVGEGGVLVRLALDGGTGELVARLVPSAVRALGLEVGGSAFAVVKSTAFRALALDA